MCVSLAADGGEGLAGKFFELKDEKSPAATCARELEAGASGSSDGGAVGLRDEVQQRVRQRRGGRGRQGGDS
jgi:hypothetical protein